MYSPSSSLGVTTRPPSGTMRVPQRGAIDSVPEAAAAVAAPPDHCPSAGCMTRLPARQSQDVSDLTVDSVLEGAAAVDPPNNCPTAGSITRLRTHRKS